MAITWFIGVHGVASGFSAIGYLRDGGVPDVAAAQKEAGDDPTQVVAVVMQAAQRRAFAELREVTFPLSVARLLLSGMLVIASGLAMAGRPGSRTLALQALAANAVLAVVDYTLTRGVRGAWIEAVVRASASLELLPEQQLFRSRQAWWWMSRVYFAVFELGTLAAASVTLLGQRTKTFFQAVAEATESAEEP